MGREAFLQSVAEYYSVPAAGKPAHEDVIYVLPNKRGAMFLKKYVQRTMTVVGRMPRFMTMRTFISICSDIPEVSSRELLFILYEAYRKAMADRGHASSVRDFDSFIFWGDMILSDFDEIDRSLVVAEDLFKNLHDLKEIQADYLDDDQKEVIRRIWGESRLTAETERFWLHLADASDAESMKSRFLFLWEILADIHRRFKQELDEKGISDAGELYRRAVDAVSALDASADRKKRGHYVFVGFNDLSVAETLIFERLKLIGRASFFWDVRCLELCGSGSAPHPIERLRQLVKAFPMPADFNAEQSAPAPHVEVYAVPSNIEQAKIAGAVISRWQKEGRIDSRNAINTAVVLPDQSLLMPLMFSIPAEVENINVSMGLAYRSTTFATLISSIVRMQMRARIIRGSYHFFYEDVAAVLNHPHVRAIASADADKVLTEIATRRMFNIPAAGITAVCPVFGVIFAPVHDMDSVDSVAAYLTGLFDMLASALARVADTEKAVLGVETEVLDFFRREVEALAGLARKYDITMGDRTFMRMFEKMFNRTGIIVNGTPLCGLQVLGVLETRTLDFDNVIILSMNEKIFPRKQYTKTMIPNALRLGFGLPDFESLEWTYAYCFYRLVARARNVALVYDSRGGQLGEISRYISQLQYLMPCVDVHFNYITLDSNFGSKKEIVVEKTPEVMKILNRFLEGGDRTFSATALKSYMRCQLQFYLQYARNMRGSDEIVDYMSSADYGSVVHEVIQRIFIEFDGSPVTSALIDNLLDTGNRYIEDRSRQVLLDFRYKNYSDKRGPLPAEAELAAGLISVLVRSDLKAERDAYCSGGRSFRFIEAEMKVDRPAWKIAPGLAVNWKMSIDRVDRADNGTLRFIDFKTGADSDESKNLDMLFSGSHEVSGIFQVLTYCESYLCIRDAEARIVPYIHPLRRISNALGIRPVKVGKDYVEPYGGDLAEEFRAHLADLFKEIFDPSVPFRQADKAEKCKFCPFLTMCGRVVPEF